MPDDARLQLDTTTEQIGTVRVDRVDADQQALAPRLTFRLLARLWEPQHKVPPVIVVGFSGDLYWQLGGNRFLVGRVHEVEKAFVLTPGAHQSQTERILVAASLTTEVLHQIELKRGSAKPTFRIALRAMGIAQASLLPDEDDPPTATRGTYTTSVPTGPSPNVVHSLHQMSADIDVELERSRWAEILEQLGYGTYRLVGVPARAGLPADTMREALARTDDAEKIIFSAATGDDYRKAVAQCRDALAQIAKAFGHPELTKDARDAILKNVTDPAVREALSKSLGALRDVTHLGHHDPGVTPSAPHLFTRGEAEYALHLTLAAIALFAKV